MKSSSQGGKNGEITIENGQVAQGNFPEYEMIRMSTSPEKEVHIIESGAASGGLGEPVTPPIAAAITNAIYTLTGQRVRNSPIKNHDFQRTLLWLEYDTLKVKT